MTVDERKRIDCVQNSNFYYFHYDTVNVVHVIILKLSVNSSQAKFNAQSFSSRIMNVRFLMENSVARFV